ncbi:MAG: hypothetical protein QXO55_07375 [Candidatus Korarchaeum sp.]
MQGLDLLKVGVLLLGISALIIAGLAVHAYYKGVLSYPAPIMESFHAYCSFNVVIIHANDDLRNVSVSSSNGTLICRFDSVPKGSDEVCNVNKDGVYVVRVGNLKRAVTCSTWVAPYPPSRGD